jgi:hypothetical protein
MSHYAKVEAGVVTQVIRADAEFIATQPGTWIQTSYNTLAGEHVESGTPLRLNYAGIGYLYNAELDAFIQPEPITKSIGWQIDPATGTWHPVEQQGCVWSQTQMAYMPVTPETGNITGE